MRQQVREAKDCLGLTRHVNVIYEQRTNPRSRRASLSSSFSRDGHDDIETVFPTAAIESPISRTVHLISEALLPVCHPVLVSDEVETAADIVRLAMLITGRKLTYTWQENMGRRRANVPHPVEALSISTSANPSGI